MVDPQAYIKQGLEIIKSLIAQGNLQAALSGCNELLKVNPYNRDVQSYLKKIENLIVKSNQKKVDADIDATMGLWKEEKYTELMQIYNRLYAYAPNYGRLTSLITKVHEKMSDQKKKERREFIDSALKAISELLRQDQYGDVIQGCNELLSIDPLNSTAKGYLLTAQNKLIDQKIKDNQRIIEGSDLDRILEFYNTLLSIRPNHEDIQKKALQVRAQLAERKVLAAKIHLNESIMRMKELFKTMEYEKVLQAAAEIDRIDPGNVSAKIYKDKAETTMEAETDTVVTKKLKDAWATLEPEYNKNRAAFVRI